MTLKTFEPVGLSPTNRKLGRVKPRYAANCPSHSTNSVPNPLNMTHKKSTYRDKHKYYSYLKSQDWKSKRKYALEFYGYTCNLCGSKNNLEVHHRTYKNLGKEAMEDLMLLCESCHYKFHKNKILKNGKVSKYIKNPNYDTQPVTYFPNRKSK